MRRRRDYYKNRILQDIHYLSKVDFALKFNGGNMILKVFLIMRILEKLDTSDLVKIKLKAISILEKRTWDNVEAERLYE
jgi:hypothetical protein